MQLQPTPELALADGQFAVTMALRLGVPLLRGDAGACRFCAAPRDVWGVHDRSCMSGGDNVCRHNAVRGLVYEFARRANVDPQLERAGIFADPGLRVELRRPADVLVTMAREQPGGGGPPTSTEHLALDIKVINAEGPGHDASGLRPDSQVAMTRYAAKAGLLNRTAELCIEHGVIYTPIVFTAQGGRSTKTDAVLQSMAKLIEAREGTPAPDILLAFHGQLSRCLALQAVRSHVRRCPPRGVAAPLAHALLAAAARRPASGDECGDD